MITLQTGSQIWYSIRYHSSEATCSSHYTQELGDTIARGFASRKASGAHEIAKGRGATSEYCRCQGNAFRSAKGFKAKLPNSDTNA